MRFFAGHAFAVALIVFAGGFTPSCKNFGAGPKLDAGRATDAASLDQAPPPADAADGDSPEDTGTIITVPPGSVQNGQPCSANGNCVSASCKDGVCCETACGGPCLACTEAYTGRPNGMCGAAKAGMDPHDDCVAGAPEACGNDGMCDGASACRKFGSNQICSPAMCAGNQFSPVSTCNGTGGCGNAAATDCGTYPCTTLGCAKPCAADGECPAQNYCAAGTCRAKKTDGDSCGEARECVSTRCIDKVCCATDCTGACMACSEILTGQRSGSCQPVQAGIDPDDNCPTEAPAMCGRDGTCDGSGACRKYDSTTKCADASCAGTMFTAARACNNGICTGPAAIDCQLAMCTAEGCRQGCTMDSECAASTYCAGGTCATRKANGAACTIGNECTSRACVDGVCCETTCAATCFACSMAKTGQPNGRCAAVTAGTDLDNDCAAQAMTTCGTDGVCDGAGVCRRWARGTGCASGMCNAGGNYISARTCDGAGVCEPATTDVCAPNVCAAAGCSRTCTTNTDCLGNTYCAGTMCAAKKAQGGACAAAVECASNYCVDGVCCDGPCTDKCNACTMTKTGQTNGRCSPVPAGMDLDNECAVDAANSCGLDGACNGSNACRIRTMGMTCGTASCAVNAQGASILTPTGACDGISACTPATPNPCPGGFTCASATACRTTCTGATHCAPGNFCSTGTGTCMPGVCTPNATRCASNGLGVETCSAMGTWGMAAPCMNQACPVGSTSCTGSCTPNATRCAMNGLGVETCSGAGAWGAAVGCTNQACPVGMMACTGICTPGAKRCAMNGLGVETCSAMGAWGTAVGCTNQACPVGMMACTGICTPGAKRCSANGLALETCNAMGLWDAGSCLNGCASSACVTCASGQTGCPPNGCKNLTSDTANCGACGMVCPQPTAGSGTPTCTASQCNVACGAGLIHCTHLNGASPARHSCKTLSWGFEDGTTGGFAITRTDFLMTTSPSQVVVSTARSQSGTRSLAIPIAVTPDHYRVEVDVVVCPRLSGALDGPANTTGKMLSAWFYFEGPEPVGTLMSVYPFFNIYTSGFSQALPHSLTASPANTWFNVTVPIAVAGQTNMHQFGLYALFNQTWNGTLYVDNIVVQ